MPTYKQHIAQATRNERLFKITKNLDKKREFCDWHVTIAFYTAVNYLEAMFFVVKPKDSNKSSLDETEHCYSHGDRNRLVLSEFKSIHPSYSKLYKYSNVARYNCYDSRDFIRENAETHLNDVKDKCIANINAKMI